MSRRCRQHVNPLKMRSLVPRQHPLQLPAKPIEVELGCGDARFLLDRAARFPACHFVGLDIRDAFLSEARAELTARQLENVTLEVCNLIVDADRLFTPGQVRRFFINFPDPWFKARQQNRRWLSEGSLKHLTQALIDGGEVFFQSDVWSISLEALSLLEQNLALRNLLGEWTFLRENPFSQKTSRELHCLAEGLPIWRLHFVKNAR